MSEQIPELPFDIESAEDDIHKILKDRSTILVNKFDAIIGYYQDEIAKLNNRIRKNIPHDEIKRLQTCIKYYQDIEEDRERRKRESQGGPF